jgi:uncharacterized damage-inducible protein DinB
MNKEIIQIVEQLKDAYEGDPWFGRNATALLAEVTEDIAFEKPNSQHSLLELVWHMINWKAFVINRLEQDTSRSVHQFEIDDWRVLDHTNKSLWQQGLNLLHQTQVELVGAVQQQNDDLLDKKVFERDYTYRKLLHGVLQHDIYHLGQVAYILKLLKNKYPQ